MYSKNVSNVFIVNELDTWSRDLNIYFTLRDSLFGSVKLTKNSDIGKYKYRGYGYGVGFDPHSAFSLPDRSIEKMTLFFELIWVHLWILIIKEKIS